MSTTSIQPSWELKLFYDGDCPICVREVAFLRGRDRHGRLDFEDIAAPGFDANDYFLDRDALDRVMHAVTRDGQVLREVSVFREAYRLVGLGWLLAWTSWPVLRHVANAGYAVFARYRVPLGKLFGRGDACDDGRCAVG